MWTTGQLGMHAPQSLLDTIFYLIGVSFGLQGGHEHRQLGWNPPQITVVAVSGERKHLLYVEDISENNCSGLKMRKVKPKHVIQHQIGALLVYLKSSIVDVHQIGFFLKPLVKPNGDI